MFLSLDQTSLQDIICTVEDNDHQEPPFSSPEVSPATAEDQQVEDVQPVGEISPHLLRQLDCDEITRIEGEFTAITQNKTCTIYYLRCKLYA